MSAYVTSTLFPTQVPFFIRRIPQVIWIHTFAGHISLSLSLSLSVCLRVDECVRACVCGGVTVTLICLIYIFRIVISSVQSLKNENKIYLETEQWIFPLLFYCLLFVIIIIIIIIITTTTTNHGDYNPFLKKKNKKKTKTRGPRATIRSPEWHSHCRHADVMQHFSNPIIATNENIIIWTVLSFEEEYMGLTVNGAWSFE